MPAPMLIKKTVVLVKAEVTVGTDSVPTGAANAVQVDVLKLTPLDAKTVDRKPIRAFFGAAEKTVVSANMKLEIEVPFSGSGTAGTAPQWDVLMQICGASATIVAVTSVTYAPVSSALKTASVYVNVDGTNHILTSARGTWEATVNAEGLPVLKFMLTGIWNALAAASLPTATYTNIASPVPVNATNTTLTLHTISVVASAFGIKGGSNVVYRNLIGSERVDITDRSSDWNATIETLPLATKDWIAAAKASAKGALALVHGLTAGNRIAVNAASAQVSAADYSDMEGVHMTSLSGSLLPSSTGNDEWSIALT